MRIILARHGETDWNAAGRVQGASDTDLNDKGRTQAEELGRRLAESGEKIDICYASLKRRAFETAEIVCRHLELEPIPVEDLREVSFGAWEGCTWPEIERQWAEEYEAYQVDRMKVGPPDGESLRDALERILPALDAVAAGPGETALVVCHSGVIRAVLGWQAGVPFDNKALYRFNVPNAQWVALDWDRTGQNR